MKMHCVFKETCIWVLVYAYDHYLLEFILFVIFLLVLGLGLGLRANFLDSDVNPYCHISIRLDPKAIPK